MLRALHAQDTQKQVLLDQLEIWGRDIAAGLE